MVASAPRVNKVCHAIQGNRMEAESQPAGPNKEGYTEQEKRGLEGTKKEPMQ